MEINTLRFGRISIEEDKVITFSQGLLGFSQCKHFILFPHKEGSPFFWLQSTEHSELAFVLLNPNIVVPDYHIDLDEALLHELDAEEDASDLEILCIVTIPEGHPEKMTVNLLGPIVINPHKKCARQVILTTGAYSHRHPAIQNKA
ncbi:MAG: flagellar assembly protein FliW [Deltaproteobacteria bacterium]|nr:flagellar assembly protein FliW [Deltaproteobacteria bacterium]